jgi:hypothetical protein
MTATERVERYIRRTAAELDREAERIRAAAEAEPFEDVRFGLLQRAEDLEAERERLLAAGDALHSAREGRTHYI